MSDTTPQPETVRPLSLGSRFVGVLTAPRQTFAAVVAHPRWLLMALVVIALTGGAQLWFQSTEVGKQVTLDASIRQIESLGITVSDEMYEQTRQGIMNPSPARLAFSVAAMLVFPFIMWTILAGVAYLVFGVFTGGAATFRQIYAVAVHSSVVGAVGALFTTPLNYVRQATSATNLAVFLPFLTEGSFAARLAGMVDLFVIWWLAVLSIGIAVAYRKKTGGVALVVFGIYALIAVAIAAFQAAGS
jgi:hypothetical protein